MTDKQIAHIGILNSYNVLVGVATYEQVINSNVSIFAHLPDENPDISFIRFLINYFQGFEMYEHCSVLSMYINDNFDSDGEFVPKYDLCDCELPNIKEYSISTNCSDCNKKLK